MIGKDLHQELGCFGLKIKYLAQLDLLYEPIRFQIWKFLDCHSKYASLNRLIELLVMGLICLLHINFWHNIPLWRIIVFHMKLRSRWLWYLRNKQIFTNDLFLRDKTEIRRIWLYLEIHNTRLEIIHIKAIDYLIVLTVCGRTDINDFPIKSTLEFSKAFEGDIELERCQNISRIITNSNIVNMNLSHCDLFSRFTIDYY